MSAVLGGGGDGSLPIAVCNLACVINVGTAAPSSHNYGFIPPSASQAAQGPLTLEDCD